MTDAIKSGQSDISLAEEQSEAEIWEFLEQVDAGEFEPAPSLEATVRIVRTLLDDQDTDG